MFPIMGSVMLLGLRAVLKYFGKKWITIILGVYCNYKLIPSENVRTDIL